MHARASIFAAWASLAMLTAPCKALAFFFCFSFGGDDGPGVGFGAPPYPPPPYGFGAPSFPPTPYGFAPYGAPPFAPGPYHGLAPMTPWQAQADTVAQPPLPPMMASPAR